MGREAARERALSALRGPARSVWIRGEYGVGTSRLAAEVAAELESDGWLSVGVTGNAALSAVPLATLAPVLVRDMSGPIASAPDTVALFSAASAALSTIARGRRILLVLEDAGHADPVSVSLIARLVDAGQLRLVTTAAHDEAEPNTLHDIAAAPDTVRIELAGLDIDQTAELLGLVLGAPIGHGTALRLHRASSGNPLFLRELVIGARDAGALVRAADHWQLTGEPVDSPALPELIRARLRSLTPGERDAVERLALCQPLSLDEFARPGAPEALADLEQHGIVQVHEAGARLHALLTHPLYAAAVRESTPRRRRRVLLGEQADLVARRNPSPADRLRVSQWRLDAGQPADPGLLLRSARLAQQADDHRGAERLVAAAIAAGGDDAAANVLHAQTLWAIGQGADALQALDRADEHVADGPGDRALHAEAATLRARINGAG
ncbi:hypothetical protein LK09_02650 [Microbacterium mangrovi]|uniref:Orc1-like AAA ATPase domain-containing protein n=1 Tax=Microbacterium mangrovi TaxID=1348253 RepID=A0A0B2AD84_9MICO|nr:hypothetical protein LK09_02650 [Microbacterium mangrovi]